MWFLTLLKSPNLKPPQPAQTVESQELEMKNHAATTPINPSSLAYWQSLAYLSPHLAHQ